ncbi:MAG: glycosyltransferase family 4 protein [Lachnospiraceae bacterium]|nr:glycosyltransferase family 4 protein [Lachnospiraceae bacterium]
MSKILIITNHSYMLYRFRLELIQTLMKDHEVVLSMPFVGHEEDFQALGLKCIDTAVDRRGINPKTDLKLFAEYRRLLKSELPDLVITYSIKPNIYAGIACSLAGIPYCANVQGLGTAFQRKGLAQFVTLLYKAAFRRVRTVFFENEGNAEEFRRRNILSAERQTLLNGAGINLESYPCRPYPENREIHFLYLGRIMKEKGMDELFEAARRLHAEQVPFVLDLVGFFEDEYKERVEELVELGIAKFHGFQEEPRPYYAAADCVVLPSYHEGMSNVLLEAAATGRPVITSRIHGCMETVIEGESGLLCEVKDAESLYEALKAFAALPREKRAAMGIRGRKHVEKRFEKSKVVEATIKALGNLEID